MDEDSMESFTDTEYPKGPGRYQVSFFPSGKAGLDALAVRYGDDLQGLAAYKKWADHIKGVALQLVKNTLLRKAMESCDKDYDELYDVLKGNTSMMLSDTANAPAKAITEFLKKNKNAEKPLFKGAFVEESVYSADQLAILEKLKSKEELIGEVITLLQSPTKNVISALQSGRSNISGILKTLSER